MTTRAPVNLIDARGAAKDSPIKAYWHPNGFINAHKPNAEWQPLVLMEPIDMRSHLCRVYLDWRNNYLTVAKFAEHHGLTEDQAGALITLAREVHNSQHPEA